LYENHQSDPMNKTKNPALMPNSASDHMHLGLEAILIKLQYTAYYYMHTSILLRPLIVELSSNGSVIYNLLQYYTSHKCTYNNGFNVQKLHSSLNKTHNNYGLSAVK
jgi:hypothetical protein